MRRIGFGMLLGACLLASCGKAPESGERNEAVGEIVDAAGNEANVANAVVNVVTPKGAGAEDEAAIRAVIDPIYAAYSTPSGPTRDPVVSPDFKAALATAEKDDETGLGYDPWCECQDYDAEGFRYTVKAVQFAPDGDHARASLSLDLGFGNAPVRKWIDFVRTSKGWLVDDLSTAEQKSLKVQIRAGVGVASADNGVG